MAARFTLPITAIAALAACGQSDPVLEETDPSDPPPMVRPDLTVANLNVLHGLLCDDRCRLADRMQLLFQWLEGSGCPDIVTLQEISEPVVEQISALMAGSICDYQSAQAGLSGVDDAMILSRHPIASSDGMLLHLGFARHLFRARIDHAFGSIDIVTTHLASGADGASDDCGAECPQACLDAGAATVRQCQAVQVGDYADALDGAVVVVSGDFNAEPHEFEYDNLMMRGWIDTHVAAALPECDAATGVGCTSGRRSELIDLEAATPNLDERIDYIFQLAGAQLATPSCTLTLDTEDSDGDGAVTGPFASVVPNPFSTSCGAAPDPVCWPSDHGGQLLDLNCHDQ